MEEPELKPIHCPFCGEKNHEKYEGYYRISHKEDCILDRSIDHNQLIYINDTEEAIQAWNTRV